MTKAQAERLAVLRLDPYSLEWDNAGRWFSEWGRSEAALLPDCRVLLANGEIRDA